MLTRTRLTLAGVLIGALLGGTLLAAPATADVECSPSDPWCNIEIEDPGGGGGDNGGGANKDPVTGTSPGPEECTWNHSDLEDKEISCTRDGGYWSNARQCYWHIAEEQPAPPAGEPNTGAWYYCKPYSPDESWIKLPQWLRNPPPGITQLTPRQAAARLIETITFDGIDIGMAPRVNPEWGHRRSYVGVPIWMWADNQTSTNWGTYTLSRTLGGVTITVTAKVTSVLWDMGDGNTVACGSAGTVYDTGYGFTESPTCGHVYRQTSKDQPDNMYTVTATSQWRVDWTGGGESGHENTQATSTAQVEIREAQSVNVDPRN